MMNGCSYIDKGKQERELQARSLHHSSSMVCVPTFAIIASAVASNAVCVMPDGGDGGDPKGAGVLTTRTRYSRERYRQSDDFYSDPRGISYPFSYIGQLNFGDMTKKEQISYNREIDAITDELLIDAYKVSLNKVDKIHRDILLSLRMKIDNLLLEHPESND